MPRPHRARHLLAPLLAVLLATTFGLATRLPHADAAQRSALADRFAFAVRDLNDDPADGRTQRAVEPALEHLRAWISSVGAGVALADLDGDGLPNDTCLVDPRDDSVRVTPTAERTGRYPAFPLRPDGVPFDARTTAPMGCATADLNEDGRLDVLVYFWGRAPLAYLRRADAPFGPAGYVATDLVDRPTERWNSTTANVLDLDGDGHLDVMVGNYFPDGARVLDPTAADDPLIRMQDSMSWARNGGRNRILRFTGLTPVAGGPARPTFADASSALTDAQARSWTLAIGGQDLDGDGRPEVYVANDFGRDQLLHNVSRPGRIRFVELRGRRDADMPKSKVLGNDSFKSMGVAFTDLNADRRPDILVSNITTPYALQESNFAFVSTGTGPLTDHAPYRDESQALGVARTGWAWDIKAADFDGDGTDEVVQALGFLRGRVNRWAELQELAMGNDVFLQHPYAWPNFRDGDDIAGHQRNPFFVRDGNRFVDISAQLAFRQHATTRGLAVGDVDHDGRADLVVANQWARSQFLHNTGPARAHLGLTLLLPATGPGAEPRPAVGASVEVRGADGTTRVGQLYPSNGHTGGNAPELLFGLGDASTPVSVTVTWRDQAGQHAMTRSLAPGWHSLVLSAA
ncbi:CRTAC1 family protein [Micromonospora sp. NPDC018662]|uniref:CRTAC1 family protein n=1 Tax=Micromonospora sp. NPDC018662 TaxID=3364238 RepID=UPI00379CBDAE